MSVTEARGAGRPPVPPGPDPDAETEVDLRRYGAAIALRWWLPLLGLIVGLAIGYALSLGGERVFRATALVYVGETLAPGGASRVPSLATNPTTARELVRSEIAIRRAARASGLRPGQIRQGLTVQPVAAEGARVAQQTLFHVGVRGPAPRRVADAANELAAVVVEAIAPITEAKIEVLEAQIASNDQELEAIDRRIAAAVESAQGAGDEAARLLALTNAGIWETRRATVQQARSDRQQLLTMARTIELPRVLQPAVAQEVTGRTRRSSVLVAGAIGLLLGLAAAILWDAVAARAGRRTAF